MNKYIIANQCPFCSSSLISSRNHISLDYRYCPTNKDHITVRCVKDDWEWYYINYPNFYLWFLRGNNYLSINNHRHMLKFDLFNYSYLELENKIKGYLAYL